MSEIVVYVFDLPDSTQALVTVYPSSRASVAFRPTPWASWGPPVWATRIERQEINEQ